MPATPPANPDPLRRVDPTEAAQQAWLDALPEGRRQEAADWLATSDDVDARIMRLPLGEAPTLEDTLTKWQVDAFDEIRTEAANDLAGTAGPAIMHYQQMAETLIDAVANGDKAPALYRSISVDQQTLSSFSRLVGKDLDMNLGSWSSVEDFALSQGSDYLDEDRPILLTFYLEPGGKGVELARYIEDNSAEWITSGRFVVDAVIPDGQGRADVYLRQRNVFTVPSHLRGLR